MSAGSVAALPTCAGTPKPPARRSAPTRRALTRVFVVLTVLVGGLVGLVRQALAPSGWATAVNVVWVGYDLLLLSVIIEAALFRASQQPRESTA